MTTQKKYPLNQSPFYKLSNHKLFCKILGIEFATLKKILKRGDDNYKFGSVQGDSGRAIQVPKPQLCRIHNRITNLLTRIEVPDYLTSGVKGRSHVYNAKLHIGEKAVAKVDIKKFYPSTTTEIVRSGMKKKFKMSSDVADTFSKLVTVNGFLPTGSSVSQILSYFVNAATFDHINLYARSRGITFSLYVDDLTFSGKIIPRYFVSYIQELFIKKKGYKLHKIRTFKETTEKVITGVVVSGNQIRVKNSQRRVISVLNSDLARHLRPQERDSKTTVDFFQKYIGHLFSAGQISPRYRQIGKRVILERRRAGIASKNQHFKSSDE